MTKRKSILLLGGVIILGLITWFLVYLFSTPAIQWRMGQYFGKLECQKKGGDWVLFAAGVDYACGYNPTSDGLKKCNNSDECESNCIVGRYGDILDLPGECQTHEYFKLNGEIKDVQGYSTIEKLAEQTSINYSKLKR